MNDKSKYPIRIYWSDEDEAFIAEVAALRSCISHRETIEEIGPLLNITELSRRTEIKRATLASKLRRKTPFTTEGG